VGEDANSIVFEYKNLTRSKIPNLPLEEMKNSVLGRGFSLSLVFCGDYLSSRLNNSYRKKNKPTNILSFPLSEKEGEIFINLKKVTSEAKKYDKKFKEYLSYIYIHGLVHLKGFDHGPKMDALEEKFKKKFKISL